MLSITPCVDAVKTFFRFSERNKLLLIFMILSSLSMTLTYKAAITVLESKDAQTKSETTRADKESKRADKAEEKQIEWMMKYIDCRNGNTKLDTMIFYLKKIKDEKIK